MSTLLPQLPQPKHTFTYTSTKPSNHSSTSSKNRIPPYGSRSNYIPRTPSDFLDGGAFPEIHIKQYPLNMGNKNNSLTTTTSSNTVSLKVDASGKIQYDAILREGMRKDQIMYTKYNDLKPKTNINENELIKPNDKELKKNLEDTQNAINKWINMDVDVKKNDDVKFVRYTPANGGGINGHNSGAKSRMIKLYEMAVDPLDPPKYRHQKLPIRPPSPPVPIMHSPPHKITNEDQKNWKIPPCISNWKNNKGFTMPLDQRLAADGRGLHNPTINDKFAGLTESLLIAERKARQEVAMRLRMKNKMKMKENEIKEAELSKMANIAKQRITNTETTHTNDNSSSDNDSDNSSSISNKSSKIRARQERDEIRKERQREIRREYRINNKKSKNNKNIRERIRDVSEIIALGKFIKNDNDNIYDRRLFNQNSGIGRGFGNDDDYNIYDGKLFKESNKKIYRPKKDMYGDRVKQIVSNVKGFGGGNVGNNDGPLRFEKDNGSDKDNSDVEDDNRDGNKDRYDKRDSRDDARDRRDVDNDRYERRDNARDRKDVNNERYDRRDDRDRIRDDRNEDRNRYKNRERYHNNRDRHMRRHRDRDRDRDNDRYDKRRNEDYKRRKRSRSRSGGRWGK